MRERLKYIFTEFIQILQRNICTFFIRVNLVISALISKNSLRDHHVTTVVFHPNLVRNRFDILVEISATIRMHNNDMHTTHSYDTHTHTYTQSNRNVHKPLIPQRDVEYFFQKFVGERAITDASAHPINFYNNGISNWDRRQMKVHRCR